LASGAVVQQMRAMDEGTASPSSSPRAAEPSAAPVSPFQQLAALPAEGKLASAAGEVRSSSPSVCWVPLKAWCGWKKPSAAASPPPSDCAHRAVQAGTPYTPFPTSSANVPSPLGRRGCYTEVHGGQSFSRASRVADARRVLAADIT
jgi:hypothetical protein